MTRSERLANDGLVGTYYYGDIKVITDCNCIGNLHYVETEFDALYNGKVVDIDIYSDNENTYYGVIL